MAAWTVIAVPLLIMFFALGMERVEARLRREDAVGPGAIVSGIARARDKLRGQGRAGTTPAPMAITAMRDDFVGSNEETIEIRLPMNEATTRIRPPVRPLGQPQQPRRAPQQPPQARTRAS